MAKNDAKKTGFSLAKMGIKARLWFLMGLALLASALLIVEAEYDISVSTETAQRVFIAKDATADILPPPMYVVGVRLLVSQVLEGTLTIDDAFAELDRQRGEYNDRVAYWSEAESYGLDKYLLGKQHDTAETFLNAVRDRILDPVKAGRVDEARQALPAIHELFMAHRRHVDKTVDYSVEFADKEIDGFFASADTMRMMGIVTLIVASIILIFAFSVVIRSIWARIGAEPERLAEVAQAVSEGDLTRGIKSKYPNSVAGSFEAMRGRLIELVSVADESAKQVVSAATEIAMGNHDLSERTQTLAAHVQLFRDNMQEMTDSIRGEAGIAHEADSLAREASEVTRSGGEIVERVVARMTDISSSSQKISEIISVINGIAFQTNILALNAAVEAARAGEQGRGFAVVATEVRGLAGRSAKASQEIAQLINESAANVEGGMDQVEQAGRTMQEIVQEFGKVSELIEKITSATEMQSGGVDTMLDSVTNIDDMNQQNAALVEQAAAASTSLQEQAERLAASVGVFRY